MSQNHAVALGWAGALSILWGRTAWEANKLVEWDIAYLAAAA